VGNAADDFCDFRQAAVDSLKHLQRVLVHEIERALDLPGGDLIAREPGNGGREGEQRQREGQRSDHHPLQQSQRIALGGLHGRSGLVLDLTSNLSVEPSDVIKKAFVPSLGSDQSGSIYWLINSNRPAGWPASGF